MSEDNKYRRMLQDIRQFWISLFINFKFFLYLLYHFKTHFKIHKW